jgi:thiosulfate reductase cytochrome b subunit
LISFDAAHAAVHHPPDRRFRIWIRPSFLIASAVLVLLPVLAAWVELFLLGLPDIPAVPQILPSNFAGPHGFPLWVRYSHFFNFLFLMMLIRSGLSILADHPRLYFNNNCTPGSEWIRLTPILVPADRLWTAKDDARYLSPFFATPGYRHTVGIARSWHFLNVYGFTLTGVFFVFMLFATEQWRRLVPHSSLVLLQAWDTWLHYATLHLPPEFNGYYGYNALQQIAYFTVVFVFGPLAILSGLAMSPAAVNRFPWYAKLFGGRQSARSIHFLTMLSFFAFIVVHVTLIVMTGFVRNMNHIVMGTDDQNPPGDDSRLCRHWGGLSLLDRRALCVVVLPSFPATRAEVHYVSFAAGHAQPPCTQSALHGAGHLSALLAERYDARPRGLEAVGQWRLPGIQAQGGRPCR